MFDIDYPGGVTIYVRNLATSQAAAGHEVYVVDGGPRREWTRHPGGFEVRSTAATTVGYLPLSMPSDPRESQELVDLLTAVSPDIVHVHQTLGMGTAFFPDLPGAGLRYVVSLHDYYLFCPRITMMDYTGQNCGGPGLVKCETCIGALDQIDLVTRVARKVHVSPPRVRSTNVTERNVLVAQFLAQAELVLAVSSRVQELFEEVYPDAPYRVLHIGNPSATAQRPEKTTSDRLRLTMLGALEPYKGAGVLEALATRIARTDLEIRFWGRTENTKWRDRVAAAGVQLMGEYKPADLPSIMAETDLGLVLPIWEDNAPQVVMEFLNYGVPVVASSMGGIPDFVDATKGRLFDPRTSTGIQEAADYIDQVDATEVRALGQRIARLTTPAQHEEALAAVYAECLAH